MNNKSNHLFDMMESYRNGISMAYFGRPISALQIGELYLLDNYIRDMNNPEWKLIIVDNIETNYVVSKDGRVKNISSDREKKHQIDYHGYPIICIQMPNGESYSLLIHRAVANAFIPNPEDKPEVNHKDGDKSHYYYMNLEWVTPSENIQHSYETGLRPIGEANPLSKYKEKDIRRICELLEKGMSLKDIAKTLDVNRQLVGNIFNRSCWKHISNEYNIPLPEKKIPIDERDIHKVCYELSMGNEYSNISNSIENPRITRQFVRSIALGKIWRSISDLYDIPGLKKSTDSEPKTLTERVFRMYDSGMNTDTSTSDILKMVELDSLPKNKTMIALIRRNYKKNKQL